MYVWNIMDGIGLLLKYIITIFFLDVKTVYAEH